MTPAALPPDEAERLLALRELLVLDTEPEPLFDHLAQMATAVCGTPIGLLSLVDADRQWFKANVGLDGLVESPRDLSFCGHAILNDALFEVPDATVDERFCDNPLVTAPGGVQSYFGAPLVLPDGQRLGTLCVVDRLPRRLSAQQRSMLSQLAQMATDALLQRRELIRRSLEARTEYERALARSENRYRRIVEDQTEMISLARPDGTLVYANRAYQARLAPAGPSLVGRNLFEFVPPEDHAALRERLAEVLRSGRSVASENRMLGPDGQACWVSWTNGAQREADGEPLLHSVGRDITDEVASREMLQRQAATLQSVTEAIPASIAVVGADGRYRFVNNAFVEWAARSREAILGQRPQDVLPDDEFQRRWPWLQRALAGEAVSFQREQSGREQPRHVQVDYIPLRLPSGQADGVLAVTQDITLMKQEEVRLRQLSQRDVLTGLLNRAGFEDELNAMLDGGHGDAMALLYIDLDQFKPVNDLHGHSVGDEVLRLFAQRLQRLVRPRDAVARLGGDEFAIMLSGVRELAHAQSVADKVIQAARAPFVVGPRRLDVGASVGIAFGAEPDTGWGELIERADAQLYRAKAAGRGRHAGADK